MQAGYRKGAELAEQRSQVHIFMAQTVGIHLSCCLDHRKEEATNVPRTADHLKARPETLNQRRQFLFRGSDDSVSSNPIVTSSALSTIS